jgi:hypothetical protein
MYKVLSSISVMPKKKEEEEEEEKEEKRRNKRRRRRCGFDPWTYYLGSSVLALLCLPLPCSVPSYLILVSKQPVGRLRWKLLYSFEQPLPAQRELDCLE